VGSNYTVYSEKKAIYANRDHVYVGAATLMYQRSGKKISITVTATARTGETHDKVNGKIIEASRRKTNCTMFCTQANFLIRFHSNFSEVVHLLINCTKFIHETL
jgi:hypothetical protein